ncbi:MAG: TIGR04086 family membrane protein [Tissierellia bacterium]|nr:TIGR04086 family membrane protein [Tissierellia bacterium]
MIIKTKSRIKFLLKGLLIAFIISIMLILLFTILLRFTSLSENRIQSLNYINIILSSAIAGIYVATRVKEKGWIHGGIIGFAYYLFIVLIDLVFFKEVNLMLLISRLSISTLSGVIGGIIGINLI